MTLAWGLFLAYVVVTLWLAWLGQRRTSSLESYAVGDRAMNPWVVGLALAASMTSTATLVINPGIVYAYGLSGVLGYGVSAGLGLSLGIVLLSKGFRRHGVTSRALSVPEWIATRYDAPWLRPAYACVNLLLLAMAVLICYGMAALLVATLGLAQVFPGQAFEVALGIVIVFVFSYVFVGGTWAHVYTNTVQGLIMLGVAVALVGSGVHLFDGHLLERLAAVDPALASAVNPGSLLFRTAFEVFVANFLIGFALAVQPHFIIKAVYVRSERHLHHYLAVAIACGVVFNLVLVCGLYARLEQGPFVERFIEANGLGIDGVMPAYIVASFPPAMGIVISIAILAAGMSTLDGLLVALSASFANDLFLPFGARSRSHAERTAVAFRAGRLSLVAFGMLAFVGALFQHHYKQFSVALFAQEGVYALLAATFVPLLFGMFDSGLSHRAAAGASVAALVVHFGFRYGRLTLLTAADYTNPGLTASYALLVSVALALAALGLGRRAVTGPA